MIHIANSFADQSRWADDEATRGQGLSLRVAVEVEISPRAITRLNRLKIAIGSQENGSEVIDVYLCVLEYQSTVLGCENIVMQARSGTLQSLTKIHNNWTSQSRRTSG